jgi:putative ABC transport system permease protein
MMKLSVMAIKNLRKNVSYYSLYLFSVAFVLLIFFCFVSFSLNEVILNKISSDGRVETMCKTVAVFIMAFVIFYMSYANKFFMQRRMRELGIYTLLGFSKTSVLLLLMFENIGICVVGLGAGIIAGGVLHKTVTNGIIALLNLAVDPGRIPLINGSAVRYSILFVLVVLVVLLISDGRFLGNSSLLDILHMEKKNEKPVKVRKGTAIAGIGMLLAGYGLALDVTRGRSSIWYTVGFSPLALLTLCLTVCGTALFIYSFLPYVCGKRRKNLKKLYQEITIIVVPKFMHRIRTNAKSLIFLILLSAGTLAILGATVLSVWYPMEALERIIPSGVEVRISGTEEKNGVQKALEQTEGAEKYTTYETTIIKAEAYAETLPEEYTVGTGRGRKPGFECIGAADYAALRRLQGKENTLPSLGENECVLIKYRPDGSKGDVGSVYYLECGSSGIAAVTVKETTLENPVGFGNSTGSLIVSDELYEKLRRGRSEEFCVLSINGEGIRSDDQIYPVLEKELPKSDYLVGACQRKQELVRENSSTLLLICFVSVIFLIATGSILYFQNISSVTYDKEDYEILKKMGYHQTMIKRAVRGQVRIYFFIPYSMGMLHSVFALICYKSALMDDLLGKSSAVMIPVLLSVLIYTVIYLIFYEITKHSCYKIAV